MALGPRLAETGGADGSFTIAADLTDDAQLHAAADTLAARWRAPDILINNAAVYPSGFLLDIDAAE